MPTSLDLALVLPPPPPRYASLLHPTGPGGTPSALCRVEEADGEHTGCDCAYQLLTLAVASWGGAEMEADEVGTRETFRERWKVSISPLGGGYTIYSR